LLLYGCPLCLNRQRVALRVFGGGGHSQHAIDRALGEQHSLLSNSHEHAQPTALKVVWDLSESRGLRRGYVLSGQDGGIDGIREASVVQGVEVPGLEHVCAGLAVKAKGGRQAHCTLGQCARLVGAQHVHAAEVLDRAQPFDDHLRVSHLASAERQADAHDRRQELGREAHGESNGEQ
jgi:hypothetical protein